MNLMYLWAKFLKKIRFSAIINSSIHKTAKVESGSHVVNSRLDRHTFCGYDCEIINCDIGAFCSIANNVVIGVSKHPMEWVSMSPVFYEGRDSVKAKFSTHQREKVKRTIIGNDVWIGESVIIRQNVTIGNGAVIGMGSVVTKDVHNFTIVAGCPATIIRKRFDEYTIKKLNEIKWWEFSDELLFKYSPYFTNPQKFIKKFEEI